TAPHETTTMSPLYASRTPRRSTTTSLTLWPLLSVTSRSTLACVSSVMLSYFSAGRTHRTCASAFPSVRQGEAVEPVAANAASRLRLGLTEVCADWEVERLVPALLEVVRELLDARLVRYRRERKWPRPRRLGGVFAGLAVHEIELLRLCVIGL